MFYEKPFKHHIIDNFFDKDTLKFILNTSPLHAQSFAIPDNEFERLKLRFKNFNINNFRFIYHFK